MMAAKKSTNSNYKPNIRKNRSVISHPKLSDDNKKITIGNEQLKGRNKKPGIDNPKLRSAINNL